MLNKIIVYYICIKSSIIHNLIFVCVCVCVCTEIAFLAASTSFVQAVCVFVLVKNLYSSKMIEISRSRILFEK